MNIDLKEVLKYVTDDDIDPKKVIAICGDIYPEEKRDRNLLNVIIMSGIINEIKDFPKIDNMRRSILIRRIEDEYCIQADNAEEAIDAWCELFLLYNRKKNTSILYNDYNEIIKDLEDKLNKANCKIVEITNKYNDLFESQEKYNKISYDNKIITKAYNDVVQKLDSCKNRIIYLETSNVDLVKKDDKYQNEIKKLKKELRNKQNVIDKNLILLSKIDEYKSKNADLESKNYYNIKEIESVCEKIIQLEEENNQLKQKKQFIRIKR